MLYTDRIREKLSENSWQGERMSLRNLVFVSMLLLPTGLCKAQTAPAKPIEPTAFGIVYHIDSSTQELKKLPDEPWKNKLRTCGCNILTCGSCYYSINVSGNISIYRLKADDRFVFVFKTGNPEKVSLYRFDQKKDRRWFDFETARGRDYTPIKGLPVEISKFGESSFQLVPASPLIPGEYAIIIADEVYTFGVD
jgi:hypothetical protein